MIIDYDTSKYDFSGLVGSLFDSPLSELDNQEEKKNLTLGNDTRTSFHKVFYQRLDEGWEDFEYTSISFIHW